jgi:hypothetical protein
MSRRKRIRFSKHAHEERMPERNISAADVLATIERPEFEFPGNRPGTLESYGTTADGRQFYVVTAQNRTFVITVVVLEELQ